MVRIRLRQIRTNPNKSELIQTDQDYFLIARRRRSPSTPIANTAMLLGSGTAWKDTLSTIGPATEECVRSSADVNATSPETALLKEIVLLKCCQVLVADKVAVVGLRMSPT